MNTKTTNAKMINTNSKLNEFLEKIKNDKIIAIDTEFLRVNTYYPQACLIQIATQNAIFCVDVLAEIDLNPLKNYLYQDDVLLVFHSGRQDLEIFYNLFKELPKNIFDTQICGSFLGYSHQVAYGDLVSDVLSIKLEKKYSRYDWSKRPLPIDVMEYALDDVIYLLKLYEKFKNYEHYNWVKQESNEMLNIDLYKINTQFAYKKVKGIGGLGKKYQQLAVSLSEYREGLAIAKNKPRKWIFDDQTLFDYATSRKEIPKKITDNLQKFDFKITKSNPANNQEKEQIKEMQKTILSKGLKYNLNPEIIASKKDILKFIRGDENNSKLNQTWRKNL
jgi:ribonuclease D